MTNYSCSVSGNKRVTIPAMSINAYENDISKLTFSMQDGIFTEDLYYYIVFKKSDKMYAIPLEFQATYSYSYIFGTSITQTSGTWNCVILVSSVEYGQTDFTDENIIFVSDVFKIKINDNIFSANIGELELPPDPNMIIVKDRLLELEASVKAAEALRVTAENEREAACAKAFIGEYTGTGSETLTISNTNITSNSIIFISCASCNYYLKPTAVSAGAFTVALSSETNTDGTLYSYTVISTP